MRRIIWLNVKNMWEATASRIKEFGAAKKA